MRPRIPPKTNAPTTYLLAAKTRPKSLRRQPWCIIKIAIIKTAAKKLVIMISNTVVHTSDTVLCTKGGKTAYTTVIVSVSWRAHPLSLRAKRGNLVELIFGAAVIDVIK